MAASPAERPAAAQAPKEVTRADVVWTLRLREHAKTVRTVVVKPGAVPLAAGDLAAWRHRSGGFYFWEVDFLGRTSAESRLCVEFCGDVEPGHDSFGAPFDNLSETRTAVVGDRNTITLRGAVTFDRDGAITDLCADRWISPSRSVGGFLYLTPRRIAVAAGQQLLFTVVMSIAPRHP
jgi:hypothetical protein